MTSRSKLVTVFEKHHDQLSIERQRKLATLQLLVNVILLVLYELAIHAWGWELKLTNGEKDVGLSLWIFSLILLTIASSFMMAMLSAPGGAATRWGGSTDPEPAFLSSYRKYVYYPAVYLNFIAIAVFVEQTGGVVKSPFSPVLFALVLGAQQLSRFKTNSRFYIIAGIVITGCLALIEQAFGTRTVAEPPSHLYFWTVACVFLLTAIFTHQDKSKNYKAVGAFPAPSHVEVYKDDQRTWRYAMHCKDTRLDPIVKLGSSRPSLANAERKVEAIVVPLLALAGPARIEWRPAPDESEALGLIRKVKV